MSENSLPAGSRPWLWICREMPWPRVSGDRVYSAGLAHALADAGVSLRLFAHAGPGREAGPDHPRIVYEPVAGGTRRAAWVALADRLPVTAGIHDTPAARAGLRRLLATEAFDAIVLDQLGSGWALRAVLAARARRLREGGDAPALIYLAHNHETRVWADMAAQAGGSLPRRVAVRRNADKVARLEHVMVTAADHVACITAEDAGAFQAAGARRAPVVVTPGYEGRVLEHRRIDGDTPRRVAMVGSFDWAIKQENLRLFLAEADPLFAAANIHFDVVGKVPPALRAELEPGLRATTLHGFVDDPAPIFARSRMAVVPEIIGGGFKLKLLDYLFARMPVAGIAAAVAGTPDALRRQMILADDCAGLARRIVQAIDDTADLDGRQARAFELARASYRWSDRGVLLRSVVYGPREGEPDPAPAASGSSPTQCTTSEARARQVA